MTIETKNNDNELGCDALLSLLADIRAAAGDPTGKLMQDELVARIEKMHSVLVFIRDKCD